MKCTQKYDFVVELVLMWIRRCRYYFITNIDNNNNNNNKFMYLLFYIYYSFIQLFNFMKFGV